MCFLSTETIHVRSVTKSFRTQSITKYMLTINTRSEATQRVMAIKLTRLTHTIAIQVHLVAESCTICSSRSKRPVRKLLDTPSYMQYIRTGIAQWYMDYDTGWATGVRFPAGTVFLFSLCSDVQTGSKAHSVFRLIGTESFPRGLSVRGVKLTTHPKLLLS
jgi:hypothetical protein